ncbi:DUF1848 domain-containing protein [Ornithobacterium rhinotracheale]|uniref:DUF1848 domain-containing protein n=1 Tax=Ornithobacterium rhinotracheale TaxID=28251 RepID=UPI00129CE67D|nr:DUF1848 domain-containing protein [Ornithobacterium rhinotracheale]MRJ11239.1 DUF1848 domain-containing protein [Ornithobacterium rhinotracheale]
MAHKKIQIQLENGELIEAQAPVIISASRSTDIPTFYADWFFDRLNKGYLVWKNPFNGVKSYVSFKKTRFIVFWSKNPAPLIDHLDTLKDKKIGCYIQYTLNDYDRNLERFLPPLQKRIDTFKKMVDELGYGRVIWRFDPLVLTDNIDCDSLLEKIEKIANQLNGYTEKLVFSYADISTYKKVKRNLEKADINYIEWKDDEMDIFAKRLAELNKSNWNFKLATCAEKIDLTKYGIEHNKCIDDELIVKLAYKDEILLKYLNYTIEFPDLFGEIHNNAIKLPDGSFAVKNKNLKDKGQRDHCECIESKDIGEYNTCPHGCEYCYANSSIEKAKEQFKKHCTNKHSETITGK